MTLYLDTSALVKLYVREAHSSVVRKRVRGATIICTSRVAYVEARAAFARRGREGTITTRALGRIVRQLDRDWSAYAVLEVTAELARRAGALAASRALRGYDALHLASALELGSLFDQPVHFLAYDEKLVRAAAAEGLLTE